MGGRAISTPLHIINFLAQLYPKYSSSASSTYINEKFRHAQSVHDESKEVVLAKKSWMMVK
jgi:hypothetical protein